MDLTHESADVANDTDRTKLNIELTNNMDKAMESMDMTDQSIKQDS